MTPEQREIVLIPVPFTDLSATKKRPVLILSRGEYNHRSPDVLVAAITSNLGSLAPGTLIATSDLEEGILPAKSLVRVDKLYSLHQGIIVKRYGLLRKEPFEAVLRELNQLIRP